MGINPVAQTYNGAVRGSSLFSFRRYNMKKYLTKISAIFAVMAILSGTLAACGTSEPTTEGQGSSSGEQIEQKTESVE